MRPPDHPGPVKAEGGGTTMSADPAPADTAAAGTSTPDAIPRPSWRWPYRWLTTGAIAVAASFFWPPLYAEPSLVMLGQDQRFWSWLIAVGGGVAVCAGLLGISANLSRTHTAWWQDLLFSLFNLAVLLLLCVGSIGALLFAGLTIDTSYRDLGNAHGDGTVAAFTPSNGYSDAELVFGTRHGAFVDFDPRTRVIITDRTLTLDDWYFALHTSPTTIQVRYTRTTSPRDLATATLNRPRTSVSG